MAAARRLSLLVIAGVLFVSACASDEVPVEAGAEQQQPAGTPPAPPIDPDDIEGPPLGPTTSTSPPPSDEASRDTDSVYTSFPLRSDGEIGKRPPTAAYLPPEGTDAIRRQAAADGRGRVDVLASTPDVFDDRDPSFVGILYVYKTGLVITRWENASQALSLTVTRQSSEDRARIGECTAKGTDDRAPGRKIGLDSAEGDACYVEIRSSGTSLNRLLWIARGQTFVLESEPGQLAEADLVQIAEAPTVDVLAG